MRTSKTVVGCEFSDGICVVSGRKPPLQSSVRSRMAALQFPSNISLVKERVMSSFV